MSIKRITTAAKLAVTHMRPSVFVNVFQKFANDYTTTDKKTKVDSTHVNNKTKETNNPPFFTFCPLMELSGKVALITGGTSGIGLAVAKNLVQSGASRVIVAGRDVQTGAQAVKALNELCDADQKAEFVPTDVTAVDQLKDLFDYTTSTHGGFDILMNSVGILSESSAKWRQMINTNVKASIACTERGLEELKKRPKKSGVILNVSAIYAIKPLPQMPIFSATNAAIVAATLGFSKLNNCGHVRLLTACLGPTDTPMLLNLAEEDIGEWAIHEKENLVDELKTKQNVEKVAKCITLMMQFANNGSICLVANGRLHRKNKETEPTFLKKSIFKF